MLQYLINFKYLHQTHVIANYVDKSIRGYYQYKKMDIKKEEDQT